MQFGGKKVHTLITIIVLWFHPACASAKRCDRADGTQQCVYSVLALIKHMHLHLQVRAEDSASSSGSSGAGILSRLGRVLKEKAAGDFERFFKGAGKTRERLGVSRHCMA